MSLESQISLMTVPQEFGRLCNAILHAEHGDDFLPVDDDQPDAGNDGYLKSQRRMFAMHCFKRTQNQGIEQLIRRKMVGDLGKALALKQAGVWDVAAWTFVSNYPVGERIAAEVVRIGGGGGVDVSWMGPAELAAAVQRHASVRQLFPALQVNEVSERLGALHEQVVELAHGLTGDEQFSGVPRTADEQARLIASRPPAWEHLLFAGALLQGVDALEFAYLDLDLAIGEREEPVDFQTALAVIEEVSDRAAAAVRTLNRAFTPNAQERAFGPPGIEGDMRSIQHLAQLIVNAYGDLLAAGNRLMVMDPPRLAHAGSRAPAAAADGVDRGDARLRTACGAGDPAPAGRRGRAACDRARARPAAG